MLVKVCTATLMLQSRLTVPLHRYAAFNIFEFCSIGCLHHPLGTDQSSWDSRRRKKKEREKDSEREHEWDRDAPQWCIQNAKEYKQTQRGADTMFYVPPTHRDTDTQIHRGMTALWQAMDDYLVALGPFSSDLAEWLQIWAKPLCKWGSL